MSASTGTLEMERIGVMETTAADLLTRARGGDGGAFDQLVAPYRRQLHVHCYRMLGSFQDAEDALQETLVAAWRALGGFEERASLRHWLYQIATNRCLKMLRSARTKQTQSWDTTSLQLPDPTDSGELPWLEPYPDSVFSGSLLSTTDPAARYERVESISLAFITALQLLPSRQRAVLILREVLGFRAQEVAEMLGSTVESVTSALKRARAALQTASPRIEDATMKGSPSEHDLVGRFVDAFESGDLDGLVALLTEDVVTSMPPVPLRYVGLDAVGRFYASVFRAGRRYALVPTMANGQPAFGMYVSSATNGIRHGSGVLVITLAGDRIGALTRFDTGVMASFGLPRRLTA